MFTEDMSVFYDLDGFAQAATYADRHGVLTPVLVIVDSALNAYGQTSQTQVGTAVISMQVAQVPAAPRRGDTFTLATGKVYTVDSLQGSDDMEHKVFVA
jgi:hypothetical protein